MDALSFSRFSLRIPREVVKMIDAYVYAAHKTEHKNNVLANDEFDAAEKMRDDDGNAHRYFHEAIEREAMLHEYRLHVMVAELITSFLFGDHLQSWTERTAAETFTAKMLIETRLSENADVDDDDIPNFHLYVHV